MITLGTTPILIRVGGMRLYGVWVGLYALGSLTLLADGGLASATSVFVAAARADGDRERERGIVSIALRYMLASGLAFSAAFGLLVGKIAQLFHDQGQDVRIALWLVALGVTPRLFQQYCGALEAGLKRHDVTARVETGYVVALQFGLVGCVVLGRGIVWLVAWYSVVTLAVCVVHIIALDRLGAPFSLRAAPPALRREVLRFSTAHWVSAIASTSFAKVDRLVVAGVLGSEALGVYGAATSVASKINEFSALPVQPLIPYVASSVAVGDLPAASRLFRAAVRLNSCIILSVSGSMLWLAPVLAHVLSRSEKGSLEVTLRILAITYAAYSFNAVGYLFLIAMKRPRLNAVTTVVGSLGSLLAIAYLGSHYGLVGAAAGNGVFVVSCLTNVAVARRLRVPGAFLLWEYGGAAILGTICVLLNELMGSMRESPTVLVVGTLACNLLAIYLGRGLLRFWEELRDGSLRASWKHV